MRWWAWTYGTGAVVAIALFFLQPTTHGVALIPFVVMAASALSSVRVSHHPALAPGYLLMFFAVYFLNWPSSLAPVAWDAMVISVLIVGALLWFRSIARSVLPSNMNAFRLEATFSWILFSFIGLLVAYYSSSAGGPGSMLGFLTRVLGINPELAGAIVVIVRKCLHFTFYGILALASSRAVRLVGVDAARATAFGILWPLSHAVFDELRQMGEVGRTGSVWDVFLDLAGVLVFLSPQIRTAWDTNRHKITLN